MIITPASTLVIKELSTIEPSLEPTISKCIQKYSHEKTICGFLKFLVDRVVNAIKSIFGSSDWQKTVSILKAKWLRNTQENLKNNTVFKNFSEIKRTQILNKTEEMADRMIPHLLTLALAYQHNPIDKALAKSTIERYTEQQSEPLKRLFG